MAYASSCFPSISSSISREPRFCQTSMVCCFKSQVLLQLVQSLLYTDKYTDVTVWALRRVLKKVILTWILPHMCFFFFPLPLLLTLQGDPVPSVKAPSCDQEDATHGLRRSLQKITNDSGLPSGCFEVHTSRGFVISGLPST